MPRQSIPGVDLESNNALTRRLRICERRHWVRNLITGYHFDGYEKSVCCLLAFLNCIFEAQTWNQLFFQQMVHALKSKVNLSGISFSPMDCLSVHYFLSSIRTVARGQIDLNLSFCSIDDQCLGILLGISSEHSETSSTSGVLESVETLQVQHNKFTALSLSSLMIHPAADCLSLPQLMTTRH